MPANSTNEIARVKTEAHSGMSKQK
jgi:hypothetical protein